MKQIIRFGTAVLATCGFVLAGPVETAHAGASASPITIGMIASLSGGGSSEQTGIEYGIEARFDAQNAKGGVDGHPLKLVTVDDQSSGAGNKTAAQVLVEDKQAFGVIDNSAFVFGAAAYLNQGGIPVIGGGADGPEWGAQPNSNMFDMMAPVTTPFDGKMYGYDTDAQFMKDIGVTKLAIISVNVPAAISNQVSLMKEATKLGIKNCYDNDSLPLSNVNFTAVALQLKDANCNGLIDAGVQTQTVTLSEAIQDAGIKTKEYYYDIPESVLDQPAVHKALTGTYTNQASFQLNDANAAQKVMLETLKKYTPQFSFANDPAALSSYEEADLMIKGLQLAGKNPTRQAFIKNLRQVANYTDGGILPSPGLTFQHFGTLGMLPTTECGQFLTVTTQGLVPYEKGKEICGARVQISS